MKEAFTAKFVGMFCNVCEGLTCTVFDIVKFVIMTAEPIATKLLACVSYTSKKSLSIKLPTHNQTNKYKRVKPQQNTQFYLPTILSSFVKVAHPLYCVKAMSNSELI